ncbi:M14 family metallopeptidase [Clostridium rectalis]|uniref:M14 family metallopeptidase n=1 Tax=Clostridium rectalis TaxID=2040295 RepID=UPI000F63AD18|nr:M14 family metallopeptidase [Clostridium rectalis]
MRELKLGSTGTEVMEIQSILKKVGFNPGKIDGIFGKNTENAVKKFQRANGLTETGIIDEKTDKLISKLLMGYDTYIIKPGDKLVNIANKYYTEVYKILIANPGLDPYNLTPGEKIKVPYGMSIVPTDVNYTYDILKRNIEALKIRYPFLTVGIAGESVLGRNLYYLKLGTGPNEVFYNGAHHSLEWITSPLLMKFAENFLDAYALGKSIRNYNIADVWKRSSIYIMPMVNPDGIELVLNGLKKTNPYYDDLIKWNKGSTDFSKDWQANNKGVDLNHNYNASWQLSKDAEKEYGVFGPGPTRYSGPYPESEPETKTVVKFTRTHNFRLVLAYHSQGQVIYWQYKDLTPPESKQIGENFSRVSGYTLAETYGIASYAGYKDWFIQDFRRPGYTIEVGLGKNPLPISQFNKIYNDNEELLILAALV